MEPSASTTSGPMSSAAPTVINGQAGNSGSGNNGSVANDGSGGGGGPASAAANQVLDRKRLQELVKEVDAHEQLDEDVEELLLHIADDFIEQTVTQAAQLAKHRRAPTVDARDVQVVLERNWNMWIPGFGSEEVRTHKRPALTEAHKSRMALIRKKLKKY